MEHKIDLIAGIEHFAKRASDYKLIYWDEENDFISCPPIDDEPFSSEVYFADVQSIVKATEENVKKILIVNGITMTSLHTNQQEQECCSGCLG